MELMSTTIEPALAPSSTPSGPSTACSTSGPSGSMVMTISERAATSFAELPRAAPAAATSSTAAGTIS